MPSSSLSYSGMKCLFISSSWFQLIEVFKGIFLNAKNECDIDVLQLIRIFYHNNYKHFIYWNGPISLLSYLCISVCNYIFKQTRALIISIEGYPTVIKQKSIQYYQKMKTPWNASVCFLNSPLFLSYFTYNQTFVFNC